MSENFLPSEKRMCHRTGFTKKCRSLVNSGKCERWKHLQGLDRNTGKMMIMAGACVDDMLPDLLIENTQINRETGAAVESFRNEMVVANERTAILMSNDLREQMIGRLERNGHAHLALTDGDPCIYEARDSGHGTTNAWCTRHGWDCPNRGDRHDWGIPNKT